MRGAFARIITYAAKGQRATLSGDLPEPGANPSAARFPYTVHRLFLGRAPCRTNAAANPQRNRAGLLRRKLALDGPTSLVAPLLRGRAGQGCASRGCTASALARRTARVTPVDGSAAGSIPALGTPKKLPSQGTRGLFSFVTPDYRRRPGEACRRRGPCCGYGVFSRRRMSMTSAWFEYSIG